MKHHSTTIPWYGRNGYVMPVLLVFALGIFAPVFTADYLYLDEAFQLWRRDSDRNYQLFAPAGRLFSGIYFQEAYSFISTVEEVKWLRIISLAGWILCSWLLFHFSKQWCHRLNLPPALPFLLSVFCICSSSVTIYVAWSSCGQIFLAFLTGLLSGHILFITLMDPGKSRFNIVWAILFGMISLLIYQTAYGIFVVPFLLLWLSGNVPEKRKGMITGVIVHFGIYLLYYLVFLLYRNTLTDYDDRTELVFQPLKKIGFFFGNPFSQAWSLNMLVNLHNVFSQAVPVVLLTTWLALFVKQSTPRKTKPVLIQLAGVILILAISYLPSLIANQNFSSYRTLISLSLCVFILFTLAVLKAIQQQPKKLAFIIGLPVLFFIIALLNYNRKFRGPLQKEYAALKQLPVMSQAKKEDTILFVRADSKLFQRLYGVKSYKDEFGSPSTYRDWVPENLTRQLIKENNSVEVARNIPFYQFADEAAYRDSIKVTPGNSYVIDMNEVLRQ
jgi:hypothetical protein